MTALGGNFISKHIINTCKSSKKGYNLQETCRDRRVPFKNGYFSTAGCRGSTVEEY